MHEPEPCDHDAVRLWHPAVAAATKDKLLPPRQAELILARPEVDALERACAALQAWCWLRGLPPLDRAISLERVQGPGLVVADYDVFFEAMGRDVHNERFVLAYPWSRVREPHAAGIARARGLLGDHAPLLRAFRFLDLESELREADAARGRKRATPNGFADWNAAEARLHAVMHELRTLGVEHEDLRPPGRAPYPPPTPRSPVEHL